MQKPLFDFSTSSPTDAQTMSELLADYYELIRFQSPLIYNQASGITLPLQPKGNQLFIYVDIDTDI